MPDTRRELAAEQTLLADNTSGAILPTHVRDAVQSCHPSLVHPTATLATGNATPVTGDLFLPTDAAWIERYSGSAGVPWGPAWSMTKPVDANYSWVQQGGAAVSSAHGLVYLSNALGSEAVNLRKKAIPQSAPWKVTARVSLVADLQGSTAAMGGLAFRQSSDGKLQFFGAAVQGGSGEVYLYSRKYTTATSFSANYVVSNHHHLSGLMHGVWLRVEDDNTNRVCSYSFDGYDFNTFHSVGRTDFLTADEYGYAVIPWGSSGTVGLSVLSLAEG